MSILRCEIDEGVVNNAIKNLGLQGYETVRYPTYSSHKEQRGFFDTFRLSIIKTTHQNRDLMVYVFPFSNPEWEATIDAVFEFERKAWVAWWKWANDCAFQLVNNAQNTNPLTVHPVPPLIQAVDKVIRPFVLVDQGGLELKAFMRPMIEWPALDFQSLTRERAQQLFRGEFGFKKACETVMTAAGAGMDIRGQKGQISGGEMFAFDASGFGMLCNSDSTGRKLLSNGHLVVPTQWRLFHEQYHMYALGRSF